MGLSSFNPDMRLNYISSQDIMDNVIDPRMLASVDVSTTANVPISYMAVPFVICIDGAATFWGASGTTGSKDIFTATAGAYPPYKFEVIDAYAVGNATAAGGTLQVANSANAISSTIACAAATTLTRATSIDITYSVFIPGTTILRILSAASANTGLIAGKLVITCVRRP
jgi:hypothetical protein